MKKPQQPNRRAKGDDRTPEDLFLQAVRADIVMFHSPENKAYVTYHRPTHSETCAVRSEQFRRWIQHQYFARNQTAMPKHAVDKVVDTIEASALYEGHEKKVHLRTVFEDGAVHIDLGDAEWRVVLVTSEGWDVRPGSSVPLVAFERRSNTGALPVPVREGCVEALRKFVNVRRESDWVLFVCWILSALRGSGPYPILVLVGTQGSSKTTLTRIARDLVDPVVTAPTRSLPSSQQDLAVSMANSFLLSFDNVSRLQDWLSDALCRVSTGSGYAQRKLYTDADETVIGGSRPVCLNGIVQFVTRPDLMDRCIIIELEPIGAERRRTEGDFWKEFEEAKPIIFGGLLEALSMGIRNHDSVRLKHHPRMADFVQFAVACQPALPWESGTFESAYAATEQERDCQVIEDDTVAQAVLEHVSRNPGAAPFERTASDWIWILKGCRELDVSGPSQLSQRLHRSAPILERAGVRVEFLRQGKPGTRIIRIGALLEGGHDGNDALEAQTIDLNENSENSGGAHGE